MKGEEKIGREGKRRMWSLRNKISLVLKRKALAWERTPWRLVKTEHGRGVKRVGGGGVSAAIIAPRKQELNQRPGERPIVLECNGNCEILLRESNCMCSSSGFSLWHWWSQWRLGKIETRYLQSYIQENRQLPEIGFHFDVRGSVTYNCHGILLLGLFSFFLIPFLFSLVYFP